MAVEEYLDTPFDGPDRDYVDGEVIARNTGELPHARLQAELFHRLRNLTESLGLGGSLVDELRTDNPQMTIPLADLLFVLD